MTRGSSSSTSRRTPLTVRLMEKFMQDSDRCYGSNLHHALLAVIGRRSSKSGADLHIRRHPPLSKAGTAHPEPERGALVFGKNHAQTNR